jgi:hypothetical protein
MDKVINREEELYDIVGQFLLIDCFAPFMVSPGNEYPAQYGLPTALRTF